MLWGLEVVDWGGGGRQDCEGDNADSSFAKHKEERKMEVFSLVLRDADATVKVVFVVVVVVVVVPMADYSHHTGRSNSTEFRLYPRSPGK